MRRLAVTVMGVVALWGPWGLKLARAQQLEFVNALSWTYPVDVAVSGDLAYLLMWNGLVIIDIGNAFSLDTLGQIYLPGEGAQVEVAGNYVYVANGTGGLQIVNVSNPLAPSIAGIYAAEGAVRAFDIAGGYTYIADEGVGVKVIDVSDPSNPSLTGSYPVFPNWFCEGICLNGDYAYVSQYYDLLILNIADPANPAFAGSYVQPGDHISRIDVRGNYAYAIGVNHIEILDISDPIGPIRIGFISASTNFDIFIAGNYAYAASYSHGLRVINIADPTEPSIVLDYLLHNEYAMSVFEAGQRAYVIENSYGSSGHGFFDIVDVADPGSPILLNYCESPFIDWGVSIIGENAYIEAPNLQVYDLVDPYQPTFLGSCTNYARGRVFISNGYAYLPFEKIRIFDVRNPSAPSYFSEIDVPGSTESMAIVGNYAFVGTSDNYEDGPHRLITYHIANPANPILESNLLVSSTGVWSNGWVAASGNYVYMAAGGLKIIDVTNPDNPSILGSYNESGFATDVAVTGNYVFYSQFDTLSFLDSLIVVDVTNPTNPVHLWGRSIPMTDDGLLPLYHIIFEGTMAYYYSERNVYVFDISDPSYPALLTAMETPGNIRGLDVTGNCVYIADETSVGIYRYNATGCSFVPGDANGNGLSNGIDAVFMVAYLKGIGSPPLNICDCPPYGQIYVAADVNGNCSANGIDVTFFVSYLKGQQPALLYCPNCPPAAR